MSLNYVMCQKVHGFVKTRENICGKIYENLILEEFLILYKVCFLKLRLHTTF